MEKKGNRTTPNLSRASPGTDVKKSLDVSTKQGPRAAPRRREPSCGFSKPNEGCRKPQSQRNSKAFDKRPKPRGYYYTGALSRNEETSIEEIDEPELGSVFLPGSKKQSLNHLLNFSFAPRENYQSDYQSEWNHDGKQRGKWLVTRKHKYNKEHFLQANCQFIVNEKGDYGQYLNNPDALVDWDLIEQVIVQVDAVPSCPICLDTPVAAKLTKCGHVYCWPCILHYLALDDDDRHKCPICYNAIKKDDLKSVVTIPHKTFNVNDTITFKLMKVQRGSSTAFPVDTPFRSSNSLIKISERNDDNCFSKLFLANIDNILEILDKEHTELDTLIAATELDALNTGVDSCKEIFFIEEAKQILCFRRNNVLDNMCSSDEPAAASSATNLECNSFEDACKVDDCGEATGGCDVPKFYYFYQAEDGQHLYLHAVNAKMLEHSYGSLEFGPKTITGRILEKESGSVTEEVRKRYRYLQHLPVTCQFELAEISLSRPVITKKTLEQFKDQVEMRKKKRQRRAKEEKRREKKIEAEERKKLGRYDPPELHLESKDQFPDVDQRHRSLSESTFLTQSDRSTSPDFLSSSLSGISLENSVPVQPAENYNVGPSFAKMLATEKKPVWPNLKKTEPVNIPSSSVKLINVTGRDMTNRNLGNIRRDSNPELEDFEPVPDFNRSFGDALAEALARSLEKNDGLENNCAGAPGKKKKNKKKLLFSTHMAFQGN